MNKDTALKAIGTIVHRTDGTPKPPARHTRKVRDWECNNYSGRLTEVTDHDGKSYLNIVTRNYSYAVFNFGGWLSDNFCVGEHPEAPPHESVL